MRQTTWKYKHPKRNNLRLYPHGYNKDQYVILILFAIMHRWAWAFWQNGIDYHVQDHGRHNNTFNKKKISQKDVVGSAGTCLPVSLLCPPAPTAIPKLQHIERLVQDFGFGAFCDSSCVILPVWITAVRPLFVNQSSGNIKMGQFQQGELTLFYKPSQQDYLVQNSVSPSTFSLFWWCCAQLRQRRTGVIACKIN